MATPDEIKAQAEGIQNSEKLLDLSNQLNNSITERKKLLKGLNSEEQLYFTTVKQQQKLSQDIAASAEKYLGYQIKSKDLAKQIKSVKDNQLKSELTFSKEINGQASLSIKLETQRREALKKALDIKKQIEKQTNLINKLDERNEELQILKNKAERDNNINLAKKLQTQIRENQRISNNKEKYIKTLTEQFDKEKNIAKTAREIAEEGKKLLDSQKKEIEFLEKNLEIRKRIEKSTGLLGAFAKSLSKIPGIGQYLNADDAINEMEKLAAEIEEAGGKATSFGNRLKIGIKGASVLAKGLYENIKSPEAVFSFFMKAALTANSEVVKLGKSLASSSEKYRENLVRTERSSNNLNVTTKNLVAAFEELVTATGFVSNFSADALETQIMLTKQFGLTAEEAAGIFKFSQLTGKSSKAVNDAMVGAFVATRNSLRVGVPFKAVIAEAAKVSGALASSFQNNPARITAAVVQAKALGTTLEQTAKQGESLLNFESSIENELKAELLTGRQLNLERARAAALAGDQVTLAEELAKNVGSIEEFDRMNILQKKAIAESVGLTTDELAKQLQNQKLARETGKSLSQITKEQALEEQKRQDVQSKFNAAIEKLQSLFGNLLAGPLGGFLDMLSTGLNIVNKLGNALSFLATPLKVIASIYLGIKTTQLTLNALKAIETGLLVKQAATEGGKLSIQNLQFLLGKQSLGVKIAAYGLSLKELIAERAKNMLTAAGNLLSKKNLLTSIGSAIMNAAAAVFKGPTGFLGPFALPIALATGAAVGALGYKFLSGDDVMSEGGYGKRTLLAPEGAIKLNNNDTVIAGTDLGGGNQSIQGPSIDLSPMIAAINEVKASVDNLMNRPVVINMDSKQVGSNLVQGSYKMA